MLFEALVPLVTLLATSKTVRAGGCGITDWEVSIGVGVSISIDQQDQCSSPGSFFTQLLDQVVCCSDKTRVPPAGITCPLQWSMQKDTQCCIPPVQVCPADCGEGYSYDENQKTCTQNTSPSCDASQWFLERTNSCCDNSWSWSPPSGPCPPAISCPSDWFWHTGDNCCKPNNDRSPAPDCGNWDEGSQCCGGPPPPPGGPPPPPQQGGWWERTEDLEARNGPHKNPHPTGTNPSKPPKGGGGGGGQQGSKRDFQGRKEKSA